MKIERALRPFQALEIPLSKRHETLPEVISKDLSWAQAGRRRLEIEIGCGTGVYALRYATENPEITYVAIEHTRERFGIFSRALARLGADAPPHLHAVHANGVGWVTHHVPPLSVDRYWFLYPNPNPKIRDRNKRWYAMPFFSRVIETLRSGGEIRLVTNDPVYAQEARHYFQEAWKLTRVTLQEFGLETCPGGVPRTAFEKKYLERGERCFEISAFKA